MRFDRRWLPVVLSVLLPACGGDETPFTMIPDEDSGEIIKDDAGPGPTFPDRGFPADEGTPEVDVPRPDAGRDAGNMDSGARDTGVIDTGTRDVGIDTGPVDTGPPYDPCSAASVIDLNMVGTLTGQTTTYAGTNAATGASAPLRSPCSTSAAYEVAFRYTPRAATRLRVSTNADGTAAGLDTIVWAQAACATLASGDMGLGCNDDSGDPPRTLASTFTTAAAVTAGTPLYIVVAGYRSASTPTGSFALSVTEVVPAMAGGACDPRDTMACVTGLRCVPTGTSTTMGTCIADGAAGGRCRSAGLSCDMGLTCSGVVTATTSRCRATVAVGMACDLAGTGDPCITASTCLTVMGNTTCVADGSVNGRCRTTGMACDTGLGCNGTASATASRCVMAVPVGGTCTSASICASGSRCVSSSGGMVCVADGGAGTLCRAEAPRGSTSLTCWSAYTTEGWCPSTVATGATCDWTGRSTACPTAEGCVATSATAGSCATAQPEAEANNVINPPTTISSTGAAFTGSITAGDRDCFGLMVPAGASIYAQVQLPGEPGCPRGGSDPYLTLYNSSGGTVTSQDDSDGFGLCPVINPTVQTNARNVSAGRYTVCVTGLLSSSTVPNYLLSFGYYR